MGALTDAADRVLRNFRRYTGDGLPGEPVDAPLPIGDPQSGLHQIPREELRGLITAAEPLYEAAVAAASSIEGPVFASVAAMLAFDTSATVHGSVVNVREYHAGTGLGAGHFWWDAFSTETADGGMIFGSAATGRWKRVEATNTGAMKLQWFGVGKDSTTNIAAVIAAVRALNSGGCNTLQCEGIPVFLESGIEINPTNAEFGGGTNQRSKYIVGLNLKALAGGWMAGDALLHVHGDEAVAMVRDLYIVNGSFNANNLVDYGVRCSEYYDHHYLACQFINFGVAGLIADRAHGPGHGLMARDCIFRVPSGFSTGKTGIITHDGDVVIADGMIEWCEVGIKAINGGIHIDGVHLSLNDTPGLWKWGIVIEDPRGVTVTRVDFDGCGLLFTDRLASRMQWYGLQVVDNDFVNTVNFTPTAGLGIVHFGTITANNYINGLTIHGNRVTRGSGSTIAFVNFAGSGAGSWLNSWECVYNQPNNALTTPGNIPAKRRLTAGEASDVVMDSSNDVIVRARTSPSADIYFHDSSNGGTNMPSIRSSGSAARLYNGTGQYVEVVTDSGTLRPGDDNDQGLGAAGNRWTQLFAGTGTISTSDEREKAEISEIPDEWLDAWGDVGWDRFKFSAAVTDKGSLARWHIGPIAQRVRDAFRARGIDPFKIGLICYDEWPEQLAVIESGKVVTPYRAAGSLYSLRPDECQAMEAAWVRRELYRLKSS